MTALLTATSKMPGKSFSLRPKVTCPTGSKYANVNGAVCSHCYACKGHYPMQNVIDAQENRYAMTLQDDFVPRMIGELGREVRCNRAYFRWHDSGDLYSLEYAKKVLEVCHQTPLVRHYLPTKEADTVRQLLQDVALPDNLVIRISGIFLDTPPRWEHVPEGCQVTVSYTDQPVMDCYPCPALAEHTGSCGLCRACWNREIRLIGYKLH